MTSTKKLFGKFISVISVVTLIITAVISLFPVTAATYYNVNYSAGNVDNIVGSSTFSLAIPAGSSFEFSDSTRFSRKGYELSSWYIETTGQYMALLQSYTMPYHDLDVVANWEIVVRHCV